MSFSDIKIASSGMFLKTESGKPVIIRLLHDDPFQYVIHGFGKESDECGGDNCSLCKEKDDLGQPTPYSKRRKRFKVNVYSHDMSKVMIWEFGPQILEQIQNCEATLKMQGLGILDVDIIVNSSGEGLDKSYSVQPAIKSKEVPVGLVLHKLDLPF